MIHCADEDININEPEVKYGHKHKNLWSSVEHDIRGKTKDRVFDKIVAQSEVYEADVILR